MSLTLSRGFRKPQTGDSGASFFPDLEHDIQQTNDHSHDGTDSQKLSVISSMGLLQPNAGGAWSVGSGTYVKTVTLPPALATAGYTVDDVNYQIRIRGTGEMSFLGNRKASPTTLEVFSNDNSIEIDVVYTT